MGCGNVGVLRNFIHYSTGPENLYGIDLLSDRIEKAKRLSPNIDFRCGDASNFLMKMRVLELDGIILWFDYHINNTQNPDVKGVKKKEIYELFPNCDIFFKRILLARFNLQGQ